MVAAKYVPKYLGGPDSGRLPLFDLDPRWTAWAGVQGISAKAQAHMATKALAVDASGAVPNINVRIIASDQADGSHGWFVHSAYPVV